MPVCFAAAVRRLPCYIARVMHYVADVSSMLCRYEGEFQAGYAHGLGQFTSEGRGEVYIGEFFAGQRHG